MKKQSLKIYALLLSLLMLLTVIPISAEDDEAVPPFNTVYYFTDNLDNTAVANNVQILQSSGYTVELYFHADQSWFWEVISFIPQLAYCQEICNQFVIIEVAQGIPFYLDTDTNDPVVLLKDAFEMFKEQGCLNLFICDTDESRWLIDEEYLDPDERDPGAVLLEECIDAHINTDLKTVFSYSVIEWAKRNGSEDLSNCTFVLDRNSSSFALNSTSETEIDPNFSYFFYDYLITELRNIYKTSVDSGPSLAQILINNNIKIFCKISEHEFVQVSGGLVSPIISTSSNDTAFYSYYLQNDYICYVGDSMPESDKGYSDVLFALNLKQTLTQEGYLFSEDDFPIYFYDEISAIPSSYITGARVLGHRMTTFPETFENILIDFVFDPENNSVQENLGPYHNWECGLCPITHKAGYLNLPGGWILFPSKNGYSGWKRKMTEGQRDYYFGLNDG